MPPSGQRQVYLHAHQRPDKLDSDPGDHHEQDTGRDAVVKEFTGGKLFGGIGNSIRGSSHQQQKGHAGYHQG